jgi:hypothetical protein
MRKKYSLQAFVRIPVEKNCRRDKNRKLLSDKEFLIAVSSMEQK